MCGNLSRSGGKVKVVVTYGLGRKEGPLLHAIWRFGASRVGTVSLLYMYIA